MDVNNNDFGNVCGKHIVMHLADIICWSGTGYIGQKQFYVPHVPHVP